MGRRGSVVHFLYLNSIAHSFGALNVISNQTWYTASKLRICHQVLLL